MTDQPDFYFVPTNELSTDQRWSTFDDIGVQTGPEPLPDWVVTESAAVDTVFRVPNPG